jgi:hypothetical protein
MKHHRFSGLDGLGTFAAVRIALGFALSALRDMKV